MRYIKTEWSHDDNGGLPILHYSSFDDKGDEVQRIEVFKSGKILYADHTNQEGIDETWLYDTTIDDVLGCDEDNDEFINTEISQSEFDKLWQNPNNPKFKP